MAKAEQTSTRLVRMDDEREVEFSGKRKMIKETVIDANGVKIRLDFSNGETRLFTIPEALYDQFAAHGAEQKLGDEIAGVEDVEDCIMGIDNLMDRLAKGQWAQRREGGGISGTSVLARALAEMSGKGMDEIKVFLATKNMAEKIALRQNQKIKPIIDRLEAEKANKKSNVDTDALLGELS